MLKEDAEGIQKSKYAQRLPHTYFCYKITPKYYYIFEDWGAPTPTPHWLGLCPLVPWSEFLHYFSKSKNRIEIEEKKIRHSNMKCITI